MKDIREVYPEYADLERFYGPGDYGPLLESFGYEILVRVDDWDYQGDSRLLFRDGDSYGILTFGWGSCSGCDALQACETYEDIERLRQELYNSIQWHTKAEALEYLRTHDWEGGYSWLASETQRFVEQSIARLQTE